MPYSYNTFKSEIRDWVYNNFDESSKILDVGPGGGTYWNLLGGKFKHIDCVEIFKPYIEKFKLSEKYENVYNTDIIGFEYGFYNLIIFGDVIEHLSVNDAINVIEYSYQRCDNMIVAVPYMFEQGECNNNIYETHKQPDLTPDMFLKRYPSLKLLYGDNKYGYYIKR